MKTKPNCMISIDRKVRESATTIVLWEHCPKKESDYPKREIDIDRLQKTIKTTKDYKGWTYTTKLKLGLNSHPKSACPIHPIQRTYLAGK